MALGAQQIADGSAGIVIAGGQESMSQSPHASQLRTGTKMGDTTFVDTMVKDGLLDAFHGYHMGQTAENIASRWQITRSEQDEFAVASQNKAEAAQKAGKFAGEIAPVTIKGRKGDWRRASSIPWPRCRCRGRATAFATSTACSIRRSKAGRRWSIPIPGCATATRGSCRARRCCTR